MAIPVVDARSLFTKALVAVYKEKTTPTSFLRSFFKTEEFGSKEISIAVQRGSEKIAVDVLRGTEGNRNIFSKSTEKIFIPPYFNEYFDATQLDLYDRMFTAKGEVEEADVTALVNEIAEKLRAIQGKIDRSYELQCAQVLLTGIVTLDKGTNIDFKRKATSKVDLSASTWATNSNNPITHIATGCEWIRKNGKSEGNEFNVIMGSSAKAAFNANTSVQSAGDILRINTMDLREPQRNSVGGTTHGKLSAGDYNIDIWTYGEFYEDSSSTLQPYIDPKTIIILPKNTNFNFAFAAVPQLLTTGITRTKGAYVLYDHVDEKATAHNFGIKSAGLAIPTAVDQIYTAQVLA